MTRINVDPGRQCRPDMQKEAAGFPKEDTPDNGGTRTAAAHRLDNLRIAEPFGEPVRPPRSVWIICASPEPFGEHMRQQPDTQKEAMKGRE